MGSRVGTVRPRLAVDCGASGGRLVGEADGTRPGLLDRTGATTTGFANSSTVSSDVVPAVSNTYPRLSDGCADVTRLEAL